ncbi:MAG: restriction endonuclease subunit S [Deltaproteobacteria bacterium]|jgi:type I restriction enzyme, S subunit|nr:restriction endonuclease subunit S [Deltaproteobacteria bacterium]
MTDIQSLVTDHLDIWTSAVEMKSTSGRGKNNKISLYGIKKLRELILELAVRGKLVPQDTNDEPASVLLEKITTEKERLIKEKKLKKQKPLLKMGEGEKSFELPKGWEWERLGNTGIGFTGKTPSTKVVEYFNGNIPFIGPGQITVNGDILAAEKQLSESGVTQSVEAVNGDVLMVCIGGSIGKCAIISTRLTFNQQINSIRPLFIYSKYLYIAVSSRNFYSSLLDHATGSATPIINRLKWENLSITIPPLSEQHRIVAKVDELMSLCDQLEQQTEDSIAAHQTLVETLLNTLTRSQNAEELTQNWNRISDHFDTLFTTEHSIDQLKQTILQLAVMGNLVPQDPNDEPASILLEKIVKEKDCLIKEKKIKKQKPLPSITEEEKPFDIPQGWEWAKLSTIANVGTGATPSRAKLEYYNPAEYNWATSGETNSDFITETKEKISLKAIKETNVSIYPIGTLIVAMYGQGKTRGQITELSIEAGTNQACAAIQLINSNVAHRKFIKLFFNKSYDEIRSFSAGGAQPNLNVGKIANTVIPIAPLNEEDRIVAKVDQLIKLCDQLKTKITESQTTQLHLTNAIAQQTIT